MRRRRVLGLLSLSAGAVAAASPGPALANSAQWADGVQELESQYWWLGAPGLQIKVAQLLVDAHRHRKSRDGWAARSRLLMLHAVTVPPVGSHRTEAALVYGQAIRDADESGYVDRRVEARGRAALVLAQSGDHVVAWWAATWANQALTLSPTPSIGRLNAQLALSHLRTAEGNLPSARKALEHAERTFDIVGTTGVGTDYSMPDWRMYLTESRLRSGWGDPAAERYQELVLSTAPAGLDRVITQTEMHRGLLLAKQGNPREGLGYATNALAKLPEAKHSLTLGLVLQEIQAVDRRDGPQPR